MRVCGVGAAGDVGAVFPDQAFATHGFAEPPDHAVFVGGGGASTVTHFFPAFGEDAVDLFLGGVVGADLRFGEHGFELTDEVG